VSTSDNGSAEPQVTPASEWKGSTQRGIVVTLPSQRVIRMSRSVDLMFMLRTGQIPNPLADALQGQIGKGIKVDMQTLNPEAFQQMAEFIDQMVCKTVIYPTILLVPEGENRDIWTPTGVDEISIADVPWDDKGFIFSVAQGGTTDLAQFREQQAKIVATMADVSGVGTTTESDSGASQLNREQRRVRVKPKS